MASSTSAADLVTRSRSKLGRLFAPHVPFDPRRTRFFYGYVVAAAATFGVVASIPGQTMGVSVFTDPLLGATGLSRVELSNAYLVGTLASGMLLPRGGRLLDAWGARPVALLATTQLGLTLVALALVDRIASFVASALPAGAAGAVAWVVLTLGFSSLRFSGQGMLTMVSRTMLGKWFERHRGKVAGASGVFVSFGFAAAPLGLDALIETLTWRGAWMTLGGVLVFGVGSVVWLSFRDNPEQCGLRMDGDAASDGGSEPVPARPGPTRDEAIRTLSFWVVTLSLALHGMMITGITFHIVDLGAQGGLDRTESVSIFLPMAAISTTLGALVGVISDRVSIRAIIAAMLVSLAVAFVATAHLGSPALFATAVASLGVAGGIFGPLSTIAMPRLFGRTHLGAIAGAQMMAMVVASALGPAYLALSMDAFGSYTPALYGACVLPAGLLGLTLYARLPDRPSAASGRGRPRERDEPADRSEP